MPNGEDKNWIRLCLALEGFHARYGHWPTRLRLPGYAYEDLRHLFRPRTLHRLLAAFETVTDNDHFAVESDGGRRYDYMLEGSSGTQAVVRARDWLGVDPDAQAVAGAHEHDGSDEQIERYDVSVGGRRSWWLTPGETIREVVRFLVYDLGLSPGRVEEISGRRLWRPASLRSMEDAFPTAAAGGTDSPRTGSLANVMRGPDGAPIELHDANNWRAYREVLYRLEAILPFGVISWKRSALLSQDALVERLGLNVGRPHHMRVPRQYAPPTGQFTPTADSYWVIEGRLLAGAYPFAAEHTRGEVKLQVLLQADVDCFIDLTHSSEQLNKYSTVGTKSVRSGCPIEHHRYSIAPGTVPERQRIIAILDAIQDALDRRRTVYVHDKGGRGRSAMIVGCFLTRLGLSGEEALVELARISTAVQIGRGTVPETSEQRRSIQTWSE